MTISFIGVLYQSFCCCSLLVLYSHSVSHRIGVIKPQCAARSKVILAPSDPKQGTRFHILYGKRREHFRNDNVSDWAEILIESRSRVEMNAHLVEGRWMISNPRHCPETRHRKLNNTILKLFLRTRK